MSLFAELKRRNVLRVAIAYLAATWLLIQVVETLFPVYGLSDAAIRIVVAIIGVGFIPVLVVAWVFELTPDGVKRDSEVDRSETVAVAGDKKFDRIILVVLALRSVTLHLINSCSIRHATWNWSNKRRRRPLLARVSGLSAKSLSPCCLSSI